MKTAFALLLAFSISTLCADESAEPALSYTLKIGERSYAITEGKAFEVDAVAAEASAELTAADHRLFTYQAVRFKYPRHFTFEADLSEASDMSWTLSGNNCNIMILTFLGRLTPKQFAENLAEQFGKGSTKVGDAKLKLGATEYEGAAADATLAGNRLLTEIFPLTPRKGWTKLIVIQDSLSDAGKHSAEHAVVLKLLGSSFAETE